MHEVDNVCLCSASEGEKRGGGGINREEKLP